MGAAIALRDVVGEAEHLLVIAVGPGERRLDSDPVLLADGIDRVGDQRLALAVEMLDKGLHATLIFEHGFVRLRAPFVAEDDAHAGVQEGQFAQPVFQRLAVIFGHGEGRRARHEAHRRARQHLAIGAQRALANLFQRRLDLAAFDEADIVLLAAAVDAQLQPVRQGVDDRDADAVQAAGNLVGVLVELTAGVQLGHDDLGRRNALGLVHLDRDAPAIVGNLGGAVGIQRDGHFVGMAGQRLVDRIVDDFVDHVVQAGPVIGVANIHAGTLADGFEALQDLDGIGAIFGHVFSCFSHGVLPAFCDSSQFFEIVEDSGPKGKSWAPPKAP